MPVYILEIYYIHNISEDFWDDPLDLNFLSSAYIPQCIAVEHFLWRRHFEMCFAGVVNQKLAVHGKWKL